MSPGAAVVDGIGAPCSVEGLSSKKVKSVSTAKKARSPPRKKLPLASHRGGLSFVIEFRP